MSIVLRQKTVVFLFLGIVTLWTLLGCACWSGVFRHQGALLLSKIAGVPIVFTTWPAHEVLLELSGKGFGANVLSEFNITSLSIFFIHSVIIWSPLLFLLRKKVSIYLVLVSQGALLAVVSVLFWYFGNA